MMTKILPNPSHPRIVNKLMWISGMIVINNWNRFWVKFPLWCYEFRWCKIVRQCRIVLCYYTFIVSSGASCSSFLFFFHRSTGSKHHYSDKDDYEGETREKRHRRRRSRSRSRDRERRSRSRDKRSRSRDRERRHRRWEIPGGRTFTSPFCLLFSWTTFLLL